MRTSRREDVVVGGWSLCSDRNRLKVSKKSNALGRHLCSHAVWSLVKRRSWDRKPLLTSGAVRRDEPSKVISDPS